MLEKFGYDCPKETKLSRWISTNDGVVRGLHTRCGHRHQIDTKDLYFNDSLLETCEYTFEWYNYAYNGSQLESSIFVNQ